MGKGAGATSGLAVVSEGRAASALASFRPVRVVPPRVSARLPRKVCPPTSEASVSQVARKVEQDRPVISLLRRNPRPVNDGHAMSTPVIAQGASTRQDPTRHAIILVPRVPGV
eukprot:1445031-Rhodomonas_salina.1